MTVMRETGLIVMSTAGGSLYQLSLQKGHLIEKQMKRLCEHDYLYLLCVQVVGREYLTLSCGLCGNIKLMNLNKQTENNSEPKLIQYDVITAFSDEKVGRMCHGEENRLFVESCAVILELDTSTTPFKKVKTINIDAEIYDLSYVPDPHRLLVVSLFKDLCAVSCDDKFIWRANSNDLHAAELVYMPTLESIIVADRSRNRVVILSPVNGSWLETIRLPDHVRNIRCLCVYNHQIVARSEGCISYFSLKRVK